MEHDGNNSAVDNHSEELPHSRWKGSKRNVKLNFYHTISKMYGTSGSRKFKAGVEPQVKVGPIIGKVTATTARILIEIDRSGMLTIEVREKPQTLEKQPSFLQKQLTIGRRGTTKTYGATGHLSDKEHVLQKGVIANRPAVFEFRDLKPETAYIVEVKGCTKDITASSFRTFPEASADALTFGVISCNKIFITDIMIPPALDLWGHLSKNIEAGKVDYLLHLGDQIYGDGDKRQDAEAGADKDAWSDRFRKGIELLKGVRPEQWIEHQDAVCEFYREVYRDTWRHPPTAKCLANCPNLMIYDDHEVRDNWGDVKEDWNKDSADFFVARCAWIVSMEYQRQLYVDVDFTKVDDVHQDYHFHLIGGVGLMFLDIRGSRTFHRVDGDKKIYLGDGQWSAIKKTLSAEGIFAEARALLVCSPAPLVFLEPRITQSAAAAFHRLEDFKGHWSFGEHIKEQIMMIDSLCEWKNAASREVLVLGGDVHCGGHSDIIKNHEILFRQLTTSAIANVPLPKSAYYFMRAAGRLGGLTDEYKFRHHKWTRSRNYGLVQVKYHSPQDETREAEPGEVEITAQLVKGRMLGTPVYAERVSNLNKSTMSCVCTS
ncbi:uncharacterized protein [Physcomitrium patens]|uniref:PhoD-like phosphatase metallophosphatase domain-containing protein n=1 Tax=Physcomitrium patens TaxID=3218 RepID=A0A7I4DC53_PHYPA|nr:uncharacterized protein LOC112280282 isoform X2 [Physcomitrium patens]|eukprot:XP_024371364.1 uncharacterized protein LOC112280282 isoform X2 [Physcomitrella patens]